MVHTVQWKHWPKHWQDIDEGNHGNQFENGTSQASITDRHNRDKHGKLNSTLTLAYSRVVPLMVEAIKSQQTILDRQQAMLDALQNQQNQQMKQLKDDLKEELRNENSTFCLAMFGVFCFWCWFNNRSSAPTALLNQSASKLMEIDNR